MSKLSGILEDLQAGKALLSDGAMGTILHSRGEDFEQCFDELNLTNPGIVAEIHRSYIEAGSQMIQTNTFGANRYKLSKHGLEDKVLEVNLAGVELAKKVIQASFKKVLIAGDVGPLGVRIAPFGRVKPEQATGSLPGTDPGIDLKWSGSDHHRDFQRSLRNQGSNHRSQINRSKYPGHRIDDLHP